MKIGNWEINKIRSERIVVFYVNSGHIIDIKQEGNGWRYSDNDILSKIYNQCTQLVKQNYYDLNIPQVVKLFNIFYSNNIEFIISKV